MEKTAIGDRFKRYEAVSDYCLTRRTPVIGRLDGRAFHTLTRGCEKPYDSRFALAMHGAAFVLAREVQGCELVYIQSDEMSLLLNDFKRVDTDAWFDYRVQKMCSIAASIAADAFRRIFGGRAVQFDARFFNVPADDVCNYFIWRQRDAERNSLQSLAQANFSAKELHQKKTPDIHEMLHSKEINWNDCAAPQKRGLCWYRSPDGEWVKDDEIPVFSQDRNYIERHLARLD